MSNQVAGAASTLQHASKRTESFLSLSEELIEIAAESGIHADNIRSPKVAFGVATDLRGYISTRNRKYSKPQGADPVWNQANCLQRSCRDGRDQE